MRFDRGLVGFGLFLVTVGAVTVAAWETPGYATATIRIALRAEVDAGSLSLGPARPCAS